MLYENCYISSNCNRTPTIADWGKNNLICYGSCNAVMIYDPNLGSGGKVTHSLVTHTKRVNSVRWLRGKNGEKELVSGSVDGTAIVWTLKDNYYKPFLLEGHTSNVNIVDGLYKGDAQEDAFIITVSIDSTVKVWHRRTIEDEFIMVQSINCDKNGVAVGVKLTLIPGTNYLLLACALDNSTIQLYVEGPDSVFNKSACLKGHEEWVRGLDFITDPATSDLILASSSQDMYIRIWRIKTSKCNEIIENSITTSSSTYEISLDSVLIGHEGWIYSVNWNQNNFQLLSASLDKSMIIWEFDLENNLWLEKVRLGEVGGNTLGFYGGLFSPDGKYILAHSYQGAFHIWKLNEKLDSWEPAVTVGGHFEEVSDLTWEPNGEFLISVSKDQTTRIHAPWPTEKEPCSWHEIARPQVHGYDIGAIAPLSRYIYASAAEEKIIRIFQSPKNFIENFNRICNFSDQVPEELEGTKGASVPSLGLSNKAVYKNNNDEFAQLKDNSKNSYPEESHFSATELNEPPTEETLIQNTLWPEAQKLYGHGYEVYSLAASSDGKYLASACVSKTREHANILLWDTKEWKIHQKLLSHNLTITQMAFSPDCQHLLSVSRDRRWSLFAKNSDQSGYELIATTDKKTSVHTRIIWCCAWTHDSKYFATGSRDGKVVIWKRNPNKEKTDVLGDCEPVLKYLDLKNESITALAFAPFHNSSYLIAVGLESGLIKLYEWSPDNWREVLEINKSNGHHLTVKRLAFRPSPGKAGSKECDSNILQLASCSSDYSVRIYNLHINLF